jgi:hypothetical protein
MQWADWRWGCRQIHHDEHQPVFLAVVAVVARPQQGSTAYRLTVNATKQQTTLDQQVYCTAQLGLI